MKIILKDHKAALYGSSLPVGSQLIGEITRPGFGGNGALIITDDGIMCQLNNGVIKHLDQKEVKVALLKAWKDSQGLTQVEAAKRLGVSKGAVNKWENGQRSISLMTVKFILKEI